MIDNVLAPVAKGEWQDTYVYADGTSVEMPWKPNQIQNYAAVIAAKLIPYAISGQPSPANGFLYLALGEGNSSWDITPPVLDPTDTTLTSEIDRISINSNTDIIYLDPTTKLVSVVPTRMVQLTVNIGFNRGIGSLREFGIVVDDATNVANTGKLFNWVRHDLITKQLAPNPLIIIRKIRIKWLIPSEIEVL